MLYVILCHAAQLAPFLGCAAMQQVSAKSTSRCVVEIGVDAGRACAVALEKLERPLGIVGIIHDGGAVQQATQPADEERIFLYNIAISIGNDAVKAQAFEFVYALLPLGEREEVEPRQAVLRCQAVPCVEEQMAIGNVRPDEHAEEQFAIHLDIALVPKGGQHRHEMCFVVFNARIGLLHKQFVGRVGLPGLGIPGVVGPAKAEGKVGFAALHHGIEHLREQPFATTKPVVPIAEALDAGFACQLRLSFAGLRHAQVVEAQVAWQLGLVVSLEEGLGTRHVGPLRESRFPPPVVLGRGIELRKVEGYGAYVVALHCYK